MGFPLMFTVISFVILSFVSPINSQALTGKFVARVGDTGVCDKHSFLMEYPGRYLQFDLHPKKLNFRVKVDLATLTGFSIRNSGCATYRYKNTVKGFLGIKKTQIVTEDVKTNNSCFFLEFGKRTSYTLCPSDDDFSTMYFQLVNALNSLRRLKPNELAGHKRMVQYRLFYKNFNATGYRTKGEHEAATAPRPTYLYGERYPNKFYEILESGDAGAGGFVYNLKKLTKVEKLDRENKKENGEIVENFTLEQADAFSKTVLLGGNNETADEKFFNNQIAEIINEIKIMFLIGEHGNIIKLEDAGTFKNTILFILEHGGDDLKAAQMMPRGPKYNKPEQQYEIALGMLAGLVHMHSKGVFHFDIKPENVTIKEIDGNPVSKIIDFGKSRAKLLLSRESLLTEKIKDGTPFYQFPEHWVRTPNGNVKAIIFQCKNERCLELKDSYAAGMTILDALIAPFFPGLARNIKGGQFSDHGQTATHFQTRFELEEVKSQIMDKKLDKLYEVALRMIEVDPRKRFTVKQAYSQLKRIIAELERKNYFQPPPTTEQSDATSDTLSQ